MIDEILLQYMNQIFNKYECIEKVVLFDSRAKGTHKVNSDIDLAVIGHLKFLFCEDLIAQLNELPTLIKFDVIDYNNLKNFQLKEHIDRVGCTIYVRK